MEISPPSNLLGNSPSSSLSGFGLQRFTLSSVSRLQTERRASLFWLEGRAKEHALKAYDSLDKHTPRRHPKLIIGYRLASRVLSVCRVVVLRDRFATDGRSCRPLRGGSRRGAMRSDAFPFLTVSIIPKATAFRERLWASVVAGFPFLCALCVLLDHRSLGEGGCGETIEKGSPKGSGMCKICTYHCHARY